MHYLGISCLFQLFSFPAGPDACIEGVTIVPWAVQRISSAKVQQPRDRPEAATEHSRATTTGLSPHSPCNRRSCCELRHWPSTSASSQCQSRSHR